MGRVLICSGPTEYWAAKTAKLLKELFLTQKQLLRDLHDAQLAR